MASFSKDVRALILHQAIAPTSSVPTSAPANHTSFMQLRNVFVVSNPVALVSLFTSERKVEPLVKSLSTLNWFVFGFYNWMYSERYLVYNLRKRGGDSADRYFKSTEMIAGVKDMRFQALMPDVLHWLGIKKIDRMVSMSDM